MPRGTCWKGYVQKGFKKKGNRSVPNCVAVQNTYLGRAIKQPSETEREFQIRHEYHTPFKGPQKAYEGKLIVDNFQELKKRVKDYSAFKKVKKMQEQDKEQYFKERDKQQEEENFERFKGDMYGVEVKKGGLIKGKPKLAIRGWK
jgi:hypothetical protein